MNTLVSMLRRHIVGIAAHPSSYMVRTRYAGLWSRVRRFRVSYSQTGEDIIIDSALRSVGVTHPSYIDIGAWQPVRANNTYYFYKRGSRGVLVEPNPELAARIRRTRRKDTCLNVGVGISEGTLDYYVMSSSQLNTFSRDHADAYVKKGSQQIRKVIPIPTTTLNSLLARYPCDILSLDVEGLDLKLLQSVDLATYRPAVICVETLIFDGTRERKVPEIAEVLTARGYELYGDTHVNSIFVDSGRRSR